MYSICGSFGEDGKKCEFSGNLSECREWLRERVSSANSGFLCKGDICFENIEWFFSRRAGNLIWEHWHQQLTIDFPDI